MANAVRQVASHCHNSSDAQWFAAYDILSYLKRIRTVHLVFESGHGTDPKVYSDSDYATSKDDISSITGSAVLCWESLAS